MSGTHNLPVARRKPSAMAYKLAIPSFSLGRVAAGHSFVAKMDAAKKYGYKGIELAIEDLVAVADELSGTAPTSGGPSQKAQLDAARHMGAVCDERGLEIVCLQPFSQYDGLIDREEHVRRLEELTFWFQLAKELGTDLIQVPANFLPEHLVTDNIDLIVNDLIEIADMGLRQNPPIRFAYENLCWSTRVYTWDKCWEIVERVNRDNFGILLDTYNIAGYVYADPTAPTGLTYQAVLAMRESIARLVARVDPDKIFYVQVVDAARLDEPLVPGHPFYNPEQPARMSWSRNCRLFYGETDRGAYLPVTDICWAIFRCLGYKGYVSLELFNRRMNDSDPVVPEELAARGYVSWYKLQHDMGFRKKRESKRDKFKAAVRKAIMCLRGFGKRSEDKA